MYARPFGTDKVRSAWQRRSVVWLKGVRRVGKTVLARSLADVEYPFLLSKDLPERDFQEWMDAFWAKDILEFFRLRQRAPFLRFVELLLLHAHLPPGAKIRYWRTRHGNEIDFVILRRGKDPIALECSWSADAIDARNLRVFRNHYPDGDNYVVVHDAGRPLEREVSGVMVTILGLADLVARLSRD